jgi:anaerobic selenocysteine-containing dehydrogenase
LVELGHKNPVWIHPSDAERIGVRTNDLVRVTTDIGHFVAKVWATEGIRPGVVACSHHMGRWRQREGGASTWASALVGIEQSAPGTWRMRQLSGAGPFKSSDPDSERVWWTDVGVHQNLTFPVHPDPVSGMHCWHQRVRVEPAHDGDQYGDVEVSTERSHELYKKWLALAKSADDFSPDGTRRPHWLLRPFRPTRSAYELPPAP